MQLDGLRQKVEDYCDREGLLQDGKPLVIGVSGGADSVCLFYLLSDICERRGISVIPVHVHHGIRGEEADRDERFVRELTKAKGVSCQICRVDVPAYVEKNGLSTEEAARILRYRELERIRVENSAFAIALAHHRDDQAETVLMNLLRGTGPVGLAGILPRSGTKIRPLLAVSRNEILDYLKENNINFVEDSTNFNQEYTRNRIRMEVLPLLENIYPRAGEHIANVAEDVYAWREYIRCEAVEQLEKNGVPWCPEERTGCPTGDEILFPIGLYRDNPAVIREEVLRIAVESIIPSRKDVSRAHYRMLESLFEEPESGRGVDLPGDIRAVRTAERVRIFRKHGDDRPIFESKELSVPGETMIDVAGEKWLFSAELMDGKVFNMKKDDFFHEKDYTKYFDYGKIENGLQLRRPKEGDFFVLDGSGRQKKLSRFYIDRKIPRDERSEQLVLADGGHIVWAMPDRISAAYRVTEKTDRILKVSRSERTEDRK